MSDRPIFYDAKGRRRRHATSVGALIAAVTGTLFVVSLLSIGFWTVLPGVKPVVERPNRPGLVGERVREAKLTSFDLMKKRKLLRQEIQATLNRKKANRGITPGRPVIAAFYSPAQETGLFSLRAHAGKITHLMPEWLHLLPSGSDIDLRDFDPAVTPHNADVLSITEKNDIQVFPILNNYMDEDFRREPVAKLLRSGDLQSKLITRLTDWLLTNKFEGVNIDFESLDEGDYALLPQFLGKLQKELHRSNLQLSVDLEVSQIPKAAEVAANSDLVVLMNYDEHDQSSEPGPIASIDWYTHNIDAALNAIPAEKLIVGMGNYAYDWTKGGGEAESISYQNAVMLAEDARDDLKPEDRVKFEQESYNSHFSYEDDEGKEHEVWLEDALSGYDQWAIANDAGVRGGALWVLGLEDPSIWTFFDSTKTTLPKPDVLRNVTFPYEINFLGQGEVLTVPKQYSQSKPGYRTITVDPENGLVDAAAYKVYPTSLVIQRSGLRKKQLALTFDDGPSAGFSSQILDELKDLDVKATFFLIGENCVRYPSLVRRMYDDGHELGNHSFTHPNLGAVKDWRVRLEIDATQRAIQSITGHSTYLFRPPYNADAEPTTGEEVKPVTIGASLGYYTIGELIDPQDWNLTEATEGGGVRKRTSEEIANTIIEEAEKGEGNVILLHDGGGDRSLTVRALRIAVPKLKAAGFQFVTVSQLMGVSRDQVMPVVSAGNLPILVGIDKIVFNSVYWIETILVVAFVTAIILGILRILFITPLALIARRRPVPIIAGPDLSVAVIIAAFNEEKVVVRTVYSVLQSDYKNLQVVVVDDGSTDDTYNVAAKAFEPYANVSVIQQENAGKAEALTNGMSHARADVYVYLDADTLLAPTAISKLVTHFGNPKVGAVAGNVKVGNRINMLTSLQAVEYISSQNLDRRAYALMNAVTVVPGAIGAWRREAVESAGGYTSDTLAEDMDLTWRVRLSGWKIENESEAVALTEAPDHLRVFFRQRFRWAFGTLQCLWKHRRAVGRFGWFGCVVVPALWVYQVLMQAFAPLVDLQLLWSIGVFLSAFSTKSVFTRDWTPIADASQNLAVVGSMYALFFVVELVGALIAFQMDKERKSLLWYLFFQRFFYRQVMYAVIWKSLWTAVRGMRTGWGKIERKGTVGLQTSERT